MVQSLLWETIIDQTDQAKDEALGAAGQTGQRCIKQRAAAAENNVKFLSDQLAVSLSTAGIVSKKSALNRIDLKVGGLNAQAMAIGQCMTPSVQTVATNAKSPFNQEKADQFFAADVLKKMKAQKIEVQTVPVLKTETKTEADQMINSLTTKHSLNLSTPKWTRSLPSLPLLFQ